MSFFIYFKVKGMYSVSSITLESVKNPIHIL